ncbi:hypothetical protein [Salinibius halmophilus]|uniref:hypothetical protein n=1 Tax=Salinibius halmophilus TaxID=1853216 RepID=UPI000E662435|nr:hypothetical protein [Salinibius halmophilus]
MSFKVNLSHLLLFLLLVGSALYIDIGFQLKPYFVLAFLAMMTCLVSILNTLYIKHALFSILSFILFVYFLYKAYESSSLFDHLYVFNILLAPVVAQVSGRVEARRLKYYLYIYIALTLVAFTAELLYRLTHPVVGGQLLSWDDYRMSFYALKISSLMYSNSNGIGMHALITICFIFSIKYSIRSGEAIPFSSKDHASLNFSILLTTFFLIFSFSRAAMLVLVFVIALYGFMVSKRFRLLSYVLLPVVMILLYQFYKSYIKMDGSFLTKFEISINLLNYFSEASFLQLFLGNNLDDPKLIFDGFSGYYGHTHYFDLAFKGGLVGSFLYLFLLLMPFFKCGKSYTFFFVAFFLLGLSNIRIFGHYIFLILPMYLVYLGKKNGD